MSGAVGVVLVVLCFLVGVLLGKMSWSTSQTSGETFRITLNKNFLKVLKEVQEKQGVSMEKAVMNSVVFLDMVLRALDGKPDHKVAIIDKDGNSVFEITLP